VKTFWLVSFSMPHAEHHYAILLSRPKRFPTVLNGFIFARPTRSECQKQLREWRKVSGKRSGRVVRVTVTTAGLVGRRRAGEGGGAAWRKRVLTADGAYVPGGVR
jgi:hypothetical protein